MIKNWLRPIIRNQYEEDHGGGGDEEEDDLDDLFAAEGEEEADDDEEEEEEEEDEEEEDQPRSRRSTQLSLEDLERIASLTRQPQYQQPEAPKTLTPEELDAKLKVFKVTPDFAKEFYDTDEPSERQIKALQGLVSGMTDHLTTVMGYANMAVEQKVNSLYRPVLDMATQQREKDFVSTMVNVYPVLKGNERVVTHVISSLRQRGFTPKDGNEAAQVIAGEVENLMKMVNPSFRLSARPRRQKPGSGTKPRMVTLSRSGGGGSGAKGKKPKQSKRPAWDEIFD